MKLVIDTQFMENYGAHDWDGKGECPQGWKYKGGDTYVVDCDLSQALDKSFYDAVAKCIVHKSDYSEEFIVGESLVDDIDFDPAKVVAEWDTAIYAKFDGTNLICEREQKSYDMSNRVVGVRTWMQNADGRYDMALRTFEEAA